MSDDSTRSDVRSRADVREIVDVFYRGLADDPMVGPYFEDVDLDEHVPRLVEFWSSIVFQSGTYRGRPFDAHVRLDGLEAKHFRRWLERFETAIDARFEGTRADRMKQRARQIATIFQSKLGLLEDKDVAQRFGTQES